MWRREILLAMCGSMALFAQTGGSPGSVSGGGAPRDGNVSRNDTARLGEKTPPGGKVSQGDNSLTGDKAPLTYELVSIHKSKPDARGYDLMNSPEGFNAAAINLRDLISEAYGFTFGDLLKEQIVGLPDWGDTQRYDIHARVDDSDVERLKAMRKAATMAVTVKAMVERTPTPEMLMLQHLLEEYFKVKVHYEQRVMPVYVMTLAKGGTKMKSSAATDPEHGSLNAGRGKIAGENVPPDFMTFLLTRNVGRPVINRTGLPGSYDFELKFAPESMKVTASDEDNGPSIFTALDEQLGLKLVPGKEPVWVVVVDHAEMPAVE